MACGWTAQCPRCNRDMILTTKDRKDKKYCGKCRPYKNENKRR